MNVLSATTVTLWVFFWASIYFGILKLAGVLRVSKDVEKMGIDLKSHAGSKSKTTGSGSGSGSAAASTDASSANAAVS
jgi:ammonia channel protein AmtB